MSRDPEDLARDMLAFSERLAAGVRSLAALPRDLRGGVTPFQEVFSLDGIKLNHYAASDGPGELPPLVVVYSLVNRPYMLDLETGRSFLAGLLQSKRDIYLIDWGYPGAEDAHLGLDDYLLRYLHGCIEHVMRTTQVDSVDMLGVCQGGTFALCYAALEPSRLRRLALIVTPVDFHVKEFLLARWMAHVDVDAMVERLGNVPGSMLNRAFLGLRPLSLYGGKSLDLLDLLEHPEELATFARMEQWLQDNPDQAGRAFREFAALFVRDNALVKGGLRIGQRAVDLTAVRAPLLNVHAAHDHIVPPASSLALAQLLPAATPYRDEVYAGGHVGVFASRAAQGVVSPIINDWFQRPL